MLDESRDALSAAAAIKAMLQGDPVGGDAQDVPLFRDPETGAELCYDKAERRLRRALRKAGYAELASGLHCLRIGGATAYANAPGGGEMLATVMGGWSSEARRLYMWAC